MLCLIILHAGEAWPVSFSNTLGHKRGLCETKGFAPANKSKGESLEERLGYSFQNPDLKNQALVRNNTKNKRYRKEIQTHLIFLGERLEFLGDAVFNMFMLEILLTRYPQVNLDVMHIKWESLIKTRSQIKLAYLLRLNQDIILAEDVRNSGQEPILHKWDPQIVQTERLLADTLEALTGAVYLDGGYIPVRRLVTHFFDFMVQKEIIADWDYKTILKKKINITPADTMLFNKVLEYEIQERTQDLTTQFMALLWVKDRVIGGGKGKTPEKAMQKAAKNSLINLRLDTLFTMDTQNDSLISQSQPIVEQTKKLKFLGHAVLDMASADILIRYYYNNHEGHLGFKREALLQFIKQGHFNLKDFELGDSSLVIRELDPYKHLEAFQIFLGTQYLKEGYIFAKKIVQQVFDSFLQKN